MTLSREQLAAVDDFLTGARDRTGVELSREGAAAILPVIRRAAFQLRMSGMIGARLDQRQQEHLRNTILGRMKDFIALVVSSHRDLAATMLVTAVTDRDPAVKALAALSCGLKEVPQNRTLEAVQSVLLDSQAQPESALAASVALQVLPDGGLQKPARRLIAELVSRRFPEALARMGMTRAQVDSGGSVALLIPAATDTVLWLIAQDWQSMSRFADK